MNNDLIFSIATQAILDGRELRSMKPNAKGVYEGIPLMVLNTTSRNNVFYDPQSVVNCIKNVAGKFANGIGEGNLEGEWGHPLIVGKEDLPRLLWIDRTKVSHYFTKVEAKAAGDHIVIYGDVVPFGPYGQYLREAFEDPKRDVSFSVRSIARETGRSGSTVYKTILAINTFDAVDTPGFKEANARFASQPSAGNESMEIMVGMDEARAILDDLHGTPMESIITDQQLLDILGANSVRIRESITGVFDPKTKAIITQNGARSVFGACFNQCK